MNQLPCRAGQLCDTHSNITNNLKILCTIVSTIVHFIVVVFVVYYITLLSGPDTPKMSKHYTFLIQCIDYIGSKYSITDMLPTLHNTVTLLQRKNWYCLIKSKILFINKLKYHGALEMFIES